MTDPSNEGTVLSTASSTAAKYMWPSLALCNLIGGDPSAQPATFFGGGGTNWRERIIVYECTSHPSNVQKNRPPIGLLLIHFKWLWVDQFGVCEVHYGAKWSPCCILRSFRCFVNLSAMKLKGKSHNIVTTPHTSKGGLKEQSIHWLSQLVRVAIWSYAVQ